MNYIGSKRSLLPFLERHILEFSSPETNRAFFDVFAGTGAVGRHFKKLGFQVISNDIQHYSYCLNRAYIGINRPPAFCKLANFFSDSANGLPDKAIDRVLDYLNRLAGCEGFVYRNYCLGGTVGTEFPRQYFTDENGKLCDAIRLQIEKWRQDKLISDNEYFYLLASLIEAVDKVANTASVYGAFLKRIKPSAQKSLKLERLDIIPSQKKHQVYQQPGASLARSVACDILYIDPPYNQRQYATNYHVLETIARYDSPPLYGVTGLRDYEHQKSDFCYRSKALKSLESLIQNATARYIFLSYNSEGLMPEQEVISMMKRYGKAELRQAAHRRFRADVNRASRRYKADQVTEYLFCLEKLA
ncbi:MAG: modification methylase [Chloracidobacterium sp. CP2_5A]|nr:MAG: modification methylase [Chloracidobacterium sp. CP2_5A]